MLKQPSKMTLKEVNGLAKEEEIVLVDKNTIFKGRIVNHNITSISMRYEDGSRKSFLGGWLTCAPKGHEGGQIGLVDFWIEDLEYLGLETDMFKVLYG